MQWLFSQLPMFSRVGAPAYKPGLQTTERLDALYGHPHRKFKTIHVAGTNGKGSTSHMIASVLQANGYRTALYTSPHLTDFRERMRINGKMIPKENVVKFVNDWKNRGTDAHPSFFELTMMMAFDWFASERVEYAVIEVGMGGRLDSTNIVKPLLSVITNISYDHTQFLGETLEAIAYEKAGIIKPDIPVVIGQARRNVKRVFEERAAELNSPIYFASKYDGLKSLVHNPDGWECTFSNGTKIQVPLAGEYQQYNIKTALCAIDVLRKKGTEISETSITRGLENVVTNTGLRGRWQKLQDNPDVICDTGHNLDGIKNTIQSLENLYQGKRVHFVVGFVNDKNVDIIADLFPTDGIFYFTEAKIPRAMKAEDVASVFESHGYSGRIYKDVWEAYRMAITNARPEDVIYVGGSTFVVADLLDSFERGQDI